MQGFQVSWDRWWSAVGAAGQGHALMGQLLQAYQEPQRHYHTLQHVRECLDHLVHYRHLAQRPEEIEAALWFHDAVYKVRAHDNEAQSAAWAGRALQDAGVDRAVIARIQSHIEATAHAALPQGVDQQLLVDVDLAILAADPLRFAQYETQVREEYAWVPSFLFRQKRHAVLQTFLARSAIYSTPEVKQDWEERARANLQASLKR